jgi:predicted Zn-dependent protease
VLDISRYEASRLLDDAKAQFTAGEIDQAKRSLTLLSENQPGSVEAAEGRTLLTKIELEEKTNNAKWEAAVTLIRTEWKKAKALELRAKWDADRVNLENEIDKNVDLAWEKEKDAVRSEWMKNS